MEDRNCPVCAEVLPGNCFRKNESSCAWCSYSDMAKRAAARYRDKTKTGHKHDVVISKDEFVSWYCGQEDCCAYCGITFAELKVLRIQRAWGYVISWDIDRIDSALPYQQDNLVLSCFVCNLAKGNHLSHAETKVIGEAVRKVWDARLASRRAVP